MLRRLGVGTARPPVVSAPGAHQLVDDRGRSRSRGQARVFRGGGPGSRSSPPPATAGAAAARSLDRIHLPGRHEPEMSLEAASFGGAPRVGLTDAGSHTGCLHRGRCRGRSRAACRLSTGGVHRRRNGPARTAEPRRAARPAVGVWAREPSPRRAAGTGRVSMRKCGWCPPTRAAAEARRPRERPALGRAASR